MRFHCRCRHCERRKTFRDDPRVLERSAFPKCACGARDWRYDKWMNNRDTGATACRCNGYPFPHRRGSFLCRHRKDGSDRLPGDPDFWDRGMTQEQHDELVARYSAEDQETFLPLEAAA
ncbi:hypothetical protein [Burkholderia gladioli]|uniref:hypothetical protein n=1 Tax=Burkholderia gladioli TaxID=28095 RepID=UPI001641ACDA|nr:hypothetical protein [Burkholderia gladioli]